MKTPLSITRYRNTRYWAIWLGGDLLAVTVYRKGAEAILHYINSKKAHTMKTPTVYLTTEQGITVRAQLDLEKTCISYKRTGTWRTDVIYEQPVPVLVADGLFKPLDERTIRACKKFYGITLRGSYTNTQGLRRAATSHPRIIHPEVIQAAEEEMQSPFGLPKTHLTGNEAFEVFMQTAYGRNADERKEPTTPEGAVEAQEAEVSAKASAGSKTKSKGKRKTAKRHPKSTAISKKADAPAEETPQAEDDMRLPWDTDEGWEENATPVEAEPVVPAEAEPVVPAEETPQAEDDMRLPWDTDEGWEENATPAEAEPVAPSEAEPVARQEEQAARLSTYNLAREGELIRLHPGMASVTLQAGDILIRRYKKALVQVIVRAIGAYEWAGEVYPTLTHISWKATGYQISGNSFFGLPATPRSARA